jgi:hypothetical protein
VFRLAGQPVHVAMAACFEKFAKVFCGLAGRIRPRHADAVEAELARLPRQRRFQLGRRIDR